MLMYLVCAKLVAFLVMLEVLILLCCFNLVDYPVMYEKYFMQYM
jgi:hypothetical protein